ncbi:hypothetical protein [Nocardia paucivorans]|uniref:hypothetical protein n=1 Tax=Nocardia paucivorans TaxID=114259 RepID=UPI0002DCB30D|nr:hypothetical protein [Nocardia paucivorans]
MLPFVYDVTKYDPADRDECGSYHGSENTLSDHGEVEAAYLTAARYFAEDTGVTRLEIRDPQVAGPINFGLEAPIEGHGLHGLFPPDLTGYHDGAWVPLDTGLELVRVMLRDNGAWCRLEVEGRFFIHIGYDQYMYIGSDRPCTRAVQRTRALGLFPRPRESSPYDPCFDEPVVKRPADNAFWAEVADLATRHGSVILQETYIGDVSRWHRLVPDNIEAVRTALTPRSLLRVWPELSTDLSAVLEEFPEGETATLVREDHEGRIVDLWVDDEDRAQLSARLTGARAATALPMDFSEDKPPLLEGALPDPDGVVRARWPI